MTKPGKPPLSAYIRTKNEARMIADVVRAALQVADEVVVVDSGSADNTINLAEEAGARVIRHAWEGFGRQKRVGEEACRHDWVLDLDADEIVTPDLAAEIAALFGNGEPPLPVYFTPTVFVPPFGEPWRGFGVQSRHKLYDRRRFRAPDHAAWDQFDIPRGVAKGRLKEPLLHYAFEDAGHLMAKLNSGSTTFARDAKQKPMALLVLRIFFGLPFYVAKRYFGDGFIRGGVYGFSFAMMAGFARWLRDVKMYEQRKIGREK